MIQFKNLALLAFLLAFSITIAQEFQGQAVYFSKTILKKTHQAEKESKSSEDVEFDKALKESMRKAFEKTFLLTFNKFESTYKEEQKLEKEDVGDNGFLVKVSVSGNGEKYKNIKEQKKVSVDEIYGKDFLIEDKLDVFNWKLINETKKIGDYTCYKAEVSIPVSEKEKENYAAYLKRQEKKKSTIFLMDEPEDALITAWYTPEIPVSQGPSKYWGLPGLILEVNDTQTIILCSKITLNPKGKIKIKSPSGGKMVTQKEFDKIKKDKTEKLQDEDGNVIFSHQE